MVANKPNLIRYVYTAGVLVTGVFLERQVGEYGGPALLASAGVVTLFWVVYYNRSILPRIDHVTEDN